MVMTDRTETKDQSLMDRLLAPLGADDGVGLGFGAMRDALGEVIDRLANGLPSAKTFFKGYNFMVGTALSGIDVLGALKKGTWADVTVEGAGAIAGLLGGLAGGVAGAVVLGAGLPGLGAPVGAVVGAGVGSLGAERFTEGLVRDLLNSIYPDDAVTSKWSEMSGPRDDRAPSPDNRSENDSRDDRGRPESSRDHDPPNQRWQPQEPNSSPGPNNNPFDTGPDQPQGGTPKTPRPSEKPPSQNSPVDNGGNYDPLSSIKAPPSSSKSPPSTRTSESPPHAGNNKSDGDRGSLNTRKSESPPHAGNNKTDGDRGSSNTRKSESPPHAGNNRKENDKADKGPSRSKSEPSTKNDTHNGQTSGPNRGLGEGGKRGESLSVPILLDLDGDGIEITELSRSNVFMDSAGDGLLHRTAWAGAGDGVLFFDANGDNRIGEKREYVFTEWDPTAASDLAALRAAFDRNGDGRLTAADINFFKFKVLVTNADGSQTARTLTELGIREIGLLGDATHIALPDGSVITGQASFTRTNGTTGTVADVILVADAEGRRVVQTITTDAAGTRTVVSQAYDADGSVSSAAVVNRTVTDTARPGTFSSKFPWRHEGCKQLQRCSGGVRAFLP